MTPCKRGGVSPSPPCSIFRRPGFALRKGASEAEQRAWRAGAARVYPQAEAAETAESQRKAREREALASLPRGALGGRATTTGRIAGLIALAALLACLLPGFAVLTGGLSLDSFQAWLIWPTLVYFVSATCWAGAHRQRTASAP